MQKGSAWKGSNLQNYQPLHTLSCFSKGPGLAKCTQNESQNGASGHPASQKCEKFQHRKKDKKSKKHAKKQRKKEKSAKKSGIKKKSKKSSSGTGSKRHTRKAEKASRESKVSTIEKLFQAIFERKDSLRAWYILSKEPRVLLNCGEDFFHRIINLDDAVFAADILKIALKQN